MNVVKLNNPRVWRTYTGGKSIDEFHGKEGIDNHYPEEWIMSTTQAINPNNPVVEGLSVIDNSKVTLKEFIESDPINALGKKFVERFGVNTSVLVKFIDSLERLTLQVHPSKEDAMKYFNSFYGKSESWYFLEGRTVDGIKPYVYLGFKEGVTKEHWIDLFNKQNIDGMLNCLNKIDVNKGDCYFIEGGIPHAIGSGCFLIEIQEPTDYTLRVEKTTPGGLTIDEHLIHQGIGYENMFKLFNYQNFSKEDIKNKYKVEKTIINENKTNIIGYDRTDYFKMNELHIKEEVSINDEEFYGLVILEGSGKIIFKNVELTYEKGNQFFIPCSVKDLIVKPTKESKMIQAFGPKI